MKNFKFEQITECKEDGEINLDRVIIEIYFKRTDKRSNLYHMEFNCETMNDMHISIIKSPYQILCEYLNYNEVHLKNHFAKHYECKLYNHHYCFPGHQIEKIIQWFETFKVMKELVK